jgi:NarL family two-component system response regulator LiaR
MSHGEAIRVLLVDDHDILRSGLAIFLEAFDDLQLVGEAATGEEAVAVCERLKPDVVLMDLVMPEMDGLEATRLIQRKQPQIRVIALTSFDDERLIEQAKDAGMCDYVLKNVSIDELATAIRKAYRGQSRIMG